MKTCVKSSENPPMLKAVQQVLHQEGFQVFIVNNVSLYKNLSPSLHTSLDALGIIRYVRMKCNIETPIIIYSNVA